MKHTATAPPAYRSRRRRRRSLAAYGFPYPPTARTITRQGTTRNDVFTYNNRSELISDVVDGTGLNGWDYDNIGNRRMEHRSDGYEIYTANQLNQYTAIEEAEGTFTPTYDADGNQTRVKTSTGIWNVTYNAKNRPVLFSKEGENLTVACTYDYMGRRATKKVTENGTVTLHQRYLYRGYLQIDSPPPHRRLTPAGQHRSAGCPPGLTAVGRVACCDLLRSNEPCIWLITWDPTQPIATRPLAIQKDGTWYTYGWDLTKNVWEAYGTTGYIGTAYTYTAYGQVTANGAVEQPIQWSSEYNDTELGLVYYNYRHYNPVNGRWNGRDQHFVFNLYLFANNIPISSFDTYGDVAMPLAGPNAGGETIGDLPKQLQNMGKTNEEITEIMLNYTGKNVETALPIVILALDRVVWPCENSTHDNRGREACLRCCSNVESSQVAFAFIFFYKEKSVLKKMRNM